MGNVDDNKRTLIASGKIHLGIATYNVPTTQGDPPVAKVTARFTHVAAMLDTLRRRGVLK